MTDPYFWNLEARIYKEILEEDMLKKFSNIISSAISEAFSKTANVSFSADTRSSIINLEDLNQIDIEQGLLTVCISSSNYPFLSFFLINPQNLSILSNILSKKQIGEDQSLGEMEKSIALEIANILQGSLIASLSDITNKYIAATTPSILTLFELKDTISKFISDSRKSGEKIVFTKSLISSGGVAFAKTAFVFGQPMIESLIKII
ncbi:MAG: hypothetical protein ISS48_03495 [Candidatus Aenigmarchaeota archaeon]|nr:hypothetical protein [Candidatus Aenigmarchaeota archaeon]